MMRYLLDASAALALLFDEPGAQRVTEILDTACMGSVNLAEVVTVLVRRGTQPDGVEAVLGTLAIPMLVCEPGLAIEAGLLWPTTKAAGSSLGDRYCLAVARRLGATLLTSDKRLAAISAAVAVKSELIR